MNPRLWLIVSLCLNLLLAGTVVWAAKSRRQATGLELVSKYITNRVVRLRHETAQTPPVTVEVTAPFHWRQVESGDYRVYIGNLRAIGCPEATIRDIIVADVNELFAARVRDLVDGVTGRFWDLMLKEEEFQRLVEEKKKELDVMGDDRSAIFEALLGEKEPGSKEKEIAQRTETRAGLRQTLDFLPDDKFERIVEIQNHFQAAKNNLDGGGIGFTHNELQQKRKELNADEERQIQALLSPQEFDEYKLRMSPAANIRNQLADFNATEEELRAITRAEMNPQKTGDQLKQLLGPDGFATYQRASDGAYRETLKITERFDLPPETAIQVYQMRKEAEAQANKIRKDENRPVEERRMILQALRTETEKSISEALDPKVFKAYQRYGSQWLSGFSDDFR